MSERGAKAAEIVQVLTAARKTISNPRNWIKDHFAYGGESSVDYIHDEATFEEERYKTSERFCALGAIRRNNPKRVGQSHPDAEMALAEMSPLRGLLPQMEYERCVYTFNDSRDTKHEDVLALFDLAIEQQCKIVREEAEKDDSHLSD